ncbi:hypothetical protein [Inhella proteolytica]|uniref:Uncharacterized protein n=1 Tax=Inhella proteolytica TaxID=2795029 RepID=A0A931J716_9BURK|nr:hypothetical protein [Inhella proteolytica]MBH9577305.1 hypothetical protein [Inhella proteolytica]
MSAVPSPHAMVWQRMRWLLQHRLTLANLVVSLLGPLVVLVFLQQIAGVGWRLMISGLAGGLGFALVLWPLAQLWGQNDPRWARLVPGHLRALRRASLLAVALVVLGSSLLVAWRWGLDPEGPLAIGAGVVALAWVLRRPRLLWALVLGAPLLLAVLALLMRAVPGLQAVVGAGFAAAGTPVAALLAAALCLWALWRWVGNGDAAHWRDHSARLQARRSAQRGWTPGEGWADQLLGRLARWFTWPREWHFQRVLHAGPVAKLDHMLSRSAHWSVRLWVALHIGALVGLLMVLAASAEKAADRPTGDTLVGLWVGALSLAFAADVSRSKALWRRQREQAVLALLPGLSSRPGQLTRALSARWLTQGLLSWGLVLLAMLAYLPSTGERIAAAMGIALAGCLPLVLAGALIDPARLPQAPSRAMEAGVFGICLIAWLLSPLGWPFALPVVAVAVAALPWALWRWQRLAHAPAPFPVGRLSD